VSTLSSKLSALSSLLTSNILSFFSYEMSIFKTDSVMNE
jgi:hypothetical protein